jgi:CDP-glucose 4,6-dehydratase
VLAESLQGKERGELPHQWNFGPHAAANVSVMDVVNAIIDSTGAQASQVVADGDHSREAQLLALDSSRSRALLGWRPMWDFSEALAKTLDWHGRWKSGEDMAAMTTSQIRDYVTGRGVDG